MDSLARHFCMKLLKVGHTQAQLQPASGVFLRCGMQSEGNFSRSKLAPVWRLELEWQADDVSVKQDRAIHICNELDDVAELGCHKHLRSFWHGGFYHAVNHLGASKL